MNECLLCGSNKLDEFNSFDRKYYKCSACSFVFLDLKERVSIDEEIARYNTHDFNLANEKTLDFIKNIIESGLKYIDAKTVLDYGCGSNFIVQHILKDKAYNVTSYDPIYSNIRINGCFDLIVASEVIEHFRYPIPEFTKLLSYLKDGGVLAISSSLNNDSIDLKSWYYLNDPTHFSIYSEESILYLANYFNLELCLLEYPRIVVLKKS